MIVSCFVYNIIVCVLMLMLLSITYLFVKDVFGYSIKSQLRGDLKPSEIIIKALHSGNYYYSSRNIDTICPLGKYFCCVIGDMWRYGDINSYEYNSVIQHTTESLCGYMTLTDYLASKNNLQTDISMASKQDMLQHWYNLIEKLQSKGL